MAVEQTIAVVGPEAGAFPVVVHNLTRLKGLRLLFIPGNSEELTTLIREFGETGDGAGIEVLDCAKNGCWEADVILFIEPYNYESSLMERIRQVSVQKTVAAVFDVDHASTVSAKTEILEKTLPHSFVVRVITDPRSRRASVDGNNSNAVKTLMDLLEKANFSLTNGPDDPLVRS